MSQTESPFESISLTLLSLKLHIWLSSQNWSEFNQEFISEVTFLLGGGGHWGVRLQTCPIIYIDTSSVWQADPPAPGSEAVSWCSGHSSSSSQTRCCRRLLAPGGPGSCHCSASWSLGTWLPSRVCVCCWLSQVQISQNKFTQRGKILIHKSTHPTLRQFSLGCTSQGRLLFGITHFDFSLMIAIVMADASPLPVTDPTG